MTATKYGSQKVAERFWKKVNKTDTCWNWTAAKHRQGYGQFRLDGKTVSAHRVAYELVKGDIPEGLVLDHKCNNTSCVNPEHLEAVSQTENIRRGTAWDVNKQRMLSKTHCPQGHEYSEENTYFDREGYRHCRICRQIQGYEYRKKMKEASL